MTDNNSPNTLSNMDSNDQSLPANVRALLEKPVVQPNDPFPFKCRGCGHLCCTEQDILVMPHEALRIEFLLKRSGRKTGLHWMVMTHGSGTGLPLGLLSMDTPSNRCIFSQSVRENHTLVGALCTIRDARPAPCRIFPLGRALSFNKDEKDKAADYELRLVDRCPGFEPESEFGVPAMKIAAPEDQTAIGWLTAQLDPEIEEERDFYMREVVPAMLDAHLHAPTEANPEGIFPPIVVGPILGALMYTPQEWPDDPSGDHAAVMKHLRWFLGEIPMLVKAVQDANQRVVEFRENNSVILLEEDDLMPPE